MEKRVIDREKMLTFLYDLVNRMVVKINEAEDVNLEFITISAIKNTACLIANEIEKGRFNA